MWKFSADGFSFLKGAGRKVFSCQFENLERRCEAKGK